MTPKQGTEDPPILPIVYYEGIDRWTAGIQLRDRVLAVEGLEEYIPNFSYKLVGIRDYGNEELLDKADEMSLIMLLNKNQTAEDLHRMLDVPAEQINRIVSNSPEHVRQIISDVVYLLCRKVNLSADETREMLSQIKEGRNMGYLFENMEHMDIQEERRKTQEARAQLEQFRAERKQAEKELEQAQMELHKKQAQLEAALKELEQYRRAEKEKSET